MTTTITVCHSLCLPSPLTWHHKQSKGNFQSDATLNSNPGCFCLSPHRPSPFKTYNSNKLQCKHILLQKNCFTQMTVPVRKSYHQLQGDRAPYTPETCLPCLLRPQLIAVELKLIKSTLKGSLVLSWAEIFTISFWLLVLKNELSVLSFKTGFSLQYQPESNH